MAIIKTERNFVYAYDPQPDDVFVRASLIGLGDAKGTLTPRHLRYQPISDYQALLDWAVSLADQMAHPIHIVPLSFSDIRNTARFTPIENAIAALNDQERGEWRQLIIRTCCDVMRDCDDQRIRADAYKVLLQLKVIRP